MIYSIFVDGEFVGITDDEYEIYEIANNCVNNLLDDDMGDRLHYQTININRWQVCNQARKNVEDRYTNTSILCYSVHEAEQTAKKLNQIDIDREREEAKLRAKIIFGKTEIPRAMM